MNCICLRFNPLRQLCGVELHGMSLAPSMAHMEILSKMYKHPDVTNSAILEPDYSRFTLIELFRARYWLDKFAREDSLETEIQKRCDHIQRQMTGKARNARMFRPYGLRVGVIFFCLTVGPFLTVTFLNGINLIRDVHKDMITLSGLWALLTFPGLVMISMIGGRIDAERIIKSFNLAGRKDKQSFSATFNAL